MTTGNLFQIFDS